MKIAPIYWEMQKFPDAFEPLIVHTGQHYDANMSQVFFENLKLPQPDIYLGVGSATHGEQTARIMIAFEQALLTHRPDAVLVVGDVNSTLACALVVSKISHEAGPIKRPLLAHVEAGLRSFDRSMPEEINRLLTDHLSDVLFTTCEEGNQNLLREGVAEEKIAYVGNVMIDSLVSYLPKAEQSNIFEQLGLSGHPSPFQEAGRRFPRWTTPYVLVTLHRPSNVDDPEVFGQILEALGDIAQEAEVLFPVHPRTRRVIEDHPGLRQLIGQRSIRLLEPLGYLDFLKLEVHAHLVITDSGGIQEETSYLGVPCLTLRPNTERPVTLTRGTNQLVPLEPSGIVKRALQQLKQLQSRPVSIPLWDGKAAQRIVSYLAAKGDGN